MSRHYLVLGNETTWCELSLHVSHSRSGLQDLPEENVVGALGLGGGTGLEGRYLSALPLSLLVLTLNKQLGAGGKTRHVLDGRGAEVPDGEPVCQAGGSRVGHIPVSVADGVWRQLLSPSHNSHPSSPLTISGTLASLKALKRLTALLVALRRTRNGEAVAGLLVYR
jgi:hypothetical protein